MQKVTKDQLEALIKSESYHVVGTTTIASLELQNGFVVTGESACMNPADFDEALGKSIARGRAVDKMWPLEGYHRLALSGFKGSTLPTM